MSCQSAIKVATIVAVMVALALGLVALPGA